MACSSTLLGICLNPPPADAGSAIFGFAEFISALALLILVFNSSDYLYKYRISIAPLPLYKITFIGTIVIGFGALITDLWFADRWLAPALGFSRADIHALLGTLFLIVTLLWIWYAFLRPPVFSRSNFRHFSAVTYRSIVRGSDAELSALGAELAYSAKNLVEIYGAIGKSRRERTEGDVPKHTPEAYAHDALMMLGNRKLCRHIVANAPITAIVFMEEAAKQKIYDVPLGEFARNITTEALLNKDSILYLEDDLDAFDLVGRQQPFSNAMYGNYLLVEGLSRGRYSPFDIDYRISLSLDGDQFDAYCRIALLTFKDYVISGRYRGSSMPLNRAFEIIQQAGSGRGRLDSSAMEDGNEVPRERLRAAMDFVKDAVTFLSKREEFQIGTLRKPDPRKVYREETVLDRLAEMTFEIIHTAAYFQAPADAVWWVHHNIIWTDLRGDGAAWDAFRFKLSRRLFDEIKDMREWPNFKGARLLAFCLNVMGLRVGNNTDFGREFYSLRKALLGWTKRNFLTIHRTNPEIAAYCMSGYVSFDEENRRLVKTYFKGTNVEAPKDYLALDEPPADAIPA
ncbi:MAG: hypothetical protein JNM03_11865 [Sphingopyxis sp.]|uniref:hypothetical protein n=1 Tax=Sphingopyxis sp. TaxID=1908224 RepID=UPI001A51183E|nr:hypothetical protein [Sphingopyxis sp.]MBL9070669.1 hypothetical protein [Sphingopyxis sp.]